ncbi:MAG: hypothetical protein ACI94Y_001245 [Maribacter sp.]|jgi:hypothetical protein
MYQSCFLDKRHFDDHWKGAFLLNINKKKFKVKCQVKSNYLWVDTNMTFFKRKNILHTIDYNLFWYDIRENAKIRVDNYMMNKHNTSHLPK